MILCLAGLLACAGGETAGPGSESGARAGEQGPWPGRAGAKHAQHPIDRAEAFRTLDPSADRDIEMLIRGLEDPDPLVRGVAVAVLIEAPPDLVLSALGGSPEEHAPDERVLLEIELLRRAGAGPPHGYDGALCRWAAGLGRPELRARAAEACVEVGEPDGRIVDELARDEHWLVRTRVALALNRAGGAAAKEVIDRLAADPHPTVRSAARARDPRGSTAAGEPQTEW